MGSFGAKHPAKATFPFAAALISANAGDHVQLALVGEATCLMKQEVLQTVCAADWPPLVELLQRVVDLDIPIYVCAGCCRVRRVSKNDVATQKAYLVTPEEILELKAVADKVIHV